MTSIEDRVRNYMRGDVCARLVSPDGREIPFAEVHNTISYAAADAVAAAYGGDTYMVPKFVGFIYGPDSNPTGLADVSDRNMEWEDVKKEMGRIGGNVQVARFSFKPTLSAPARDDADSNDDDGKYKNNAVTFHACTRSGAAGRYAFDTSDGSGYAGKFKNGMYIYHAMLLSPKSDCECDDQEYNVLARVSLDRNGTFRQKPEDYELALDWCVTFF